MLSFQLFVNPFVAGKHSTLTTLLLWWGLAAVGMMPFLQRPMWYRLGPQCHSEMGPSERTPGPWSGSWTPLLLPFCFLAWSMCFGYTTSSHHSVRPLPQAPWWQGHVTMGPRTEGQSKSFLSIGWLSGTCSQWWDAHWLGCLQWTLWFGGSSCALLVSTHISEFRKTLVKVTDQWNPSTYEAEAGRLGRFWGQPGLYSQFQASLGDLRACLKKKRREFTHKSTHKVKYSSKRTSILKLWNWCCLLRN